MIPSLCNLNLLDPLNPLGSSPTLSLEGESLEKRIGRATVEGITKLWSAAVRSKSGFLSDNKVIREGVWYPSEHWKSVSSIKDSAIKVIEFLKKKNGYPCGYLDGKCFEPIQDFGHGSFNGQRRLHFLLKEGVLPTDALKAAEKGLSIIDCGVACQFARYHALSVVLGEKKFNILFGNSSRGQKMNLGYLIDDHLQPIQYFVRFTDEAIECAIRDNLKKSSIEVRGELGKRAVKLGQLVEIKGVANYPRKHPWGEHVGYNLICIHDKPGEQRFKGLGIEGTEKEIGEGLLQAYNKDFHWDGVAPYLKNDEHNSIAGKYAKDRQDSLKSEKNEGFNPLSIQEYNLSLVQDLINLPEDQVSMDYVKNHSSHKVDREYKLYSKVNRS